MEKYYTVNEVAEMTGLTSRTIRTYIAEGRLTGMRLGKQWRFTEDDIAALYTSPGGGASYREKLFKGDVGQQAGLFLSQEHSTTTVCVIVDCADMTEENTASLAERLREKASASGDPVIIQEGTKLMFTGTAAQTSKLLKLVKNGQ